MNTRPRFIDTKSMRFWRAIDAELARLDERPALFAETETLFRCGYSVAQAIRALTGRRPMLRLVVNAEV